MRAAAIAVNLGASLLVVAVAGATAQDVLVHGAVTTVTGSPVAGARVSVITTDKSDQARVVRTQADSTGSFSVQTPNPRGLLVVEAAGYVTARTPLSVMNGGALSIQLSRALTVTGRVIAEGTGRPLVAAVTAIQVTPGVETQTVWADSAGAFSIGGLAAGDLTILARAEGYGDQQLSVRVGTASMQNLLIRLPVSATIAGSVIQPSGAPVSGAKVSVVVDRVRRAPIALATEPALTKTITDGSFRLSAPPRVPVAFRIESNRCEAAVTMAITLDPGETRNVGAITLTGCR